MSDTGTLHIHEPRLPLRDIAVRDVQTCELCHGRGWRPEETEESKRANDAYNYDYREAYCSCPASERLRERDAAGNR